MRPINFVASIFFLSSALAAETAPKDVYSLMTIRDYQQACNQAKGLCESCPDSKEAQEAYIHALARFGDERGMLAAWECYRERYPEEAYDRHLLESMAWGIIEKGEHSNTPIVRTYALLGGFFGQDARGVEMLCRNLSDPCAPVRAVAVQLASSLRDADLQEGVLQLLQKERHGQVRLEAIKAMGTMKIQQARPRLVAIVANDRAPAEEKAAAMESLVHLLERPQQAEVAKLAASGRAGLRQLACQVVATVGEEQDAPPIFPLLNDPCPDVRCAALQTIGLLRIKEWSGQPVVRHIGFLLEDPDPEVAVTAAWAVTLADPELGLNAFQRWLQHPNPEVRLLAGAALKSTGHYGAPLLRKTFAETDDPYLKINVALGLISLRESCGEACRVIYQTLDKNDQLMWEQKGSFRYLAPSKPKYSALTPNQPEVVNQLTRLELLNVLAVMEDPYVQPAIKHFLTERAWGVTGLAAALLLTEGDPLALKHVEALLKDPNKKVQVQAALILALWGRGEGAITVLQDAYDGADREMKERLIDGIGHVGAPSSLPFLTQRLKESSPTLRIIAAASLLNCLYH